MTGQLIICCTNSYLGLAEWGAKRREAESQADRFWFFARDSSASFCLNFSKAD
jgi:7-keto-8-aminopelargonate synthetase-like enzyme